MSTKKRSAAKKTASRIHPVGYDLTKKGRRRNVKEPPYMLEVTFTPRKGETETPYLHAIGRIVGFECEAQSVGNGEVLLGFYDKKLAEQRAKQLRAYSPRIKASVATLATAQSPRRADLGSAKYKLVVSFRLPTGARVKAYDQRLARAAGGDPADVAVSKSGVRTMHWLFLSRAAAEDTAADIRRLGNFHTDVKPLAKPGHSAGHLSARELQQYKPAVLRAKRITVLKRASKNAQDRYEFATAHFLNKMIDAEKHREDTTKWRIPKYVIEAIVRAEANPAGAHGAARTNVDTPAPFALRSPRHAGMSSGDARIDQLAELLVSEKYPIPWDGIGPSAKQFTPREFATIILKQAEILQSKGANSREALRRAINYGDARPEFAKRVRRIVEAFDTDGRAGGKSPSKKHLAADAQDFRLITKDARDIEGAVRRLERRDENEKRRKKKSSCGCGG